jgi:hypothetical protein
MLNSAVEKKFYSILCVITICYQCVASSVTPDNEGVSAKNLNTRKLLIVSYDAFRNEYFQRNVTAYMNEFRKNGKKSKRHSLPFVHQKKTYRFLFSRHLR